MPVLSLFDRVTTDAYLPASLRAAMELAHADAVYVGTRPRAMRRDVEVMLTADELEDHADGHPHVRTTHTIRAEVMVRHRDDSARAGTEPSKHLRRLLEAGRLAFRDRRPWQPDLPDVMAVDAEIATPNAEPNNSVGARGALLFRVLVDGDGFELVPGGFGGGS